MSAEFINDEFAALFLNGTAEGVRKGWITRKAEGEAEDSNGTPEFPQSQWKEHKLPRNLTEDVWKWNQLNSQAKAFIRVGQMPPMELQKEIEALKNVYGGMPPKLPGQL